MEFLKYARARSGMTQQDLANVMRVCLTTVSNWECGRVLPRKRDWELLAQVLGDDTLPSQFAALASKQKGVA